jgi:hypothetical protein
MDVTNENCKLIPPRSGIISSSDQVWKAIKSVRNSGKKVEKMAVTSSRLVYKKP